MLKMMDEGETLALIRHYGHELSGVGLGAIVYTRYDIISFAERVLQLAKNLPEKNSAYLREE